jgi:hypothetical protein
MAPGDRHQAGAGCAAEWTQLLKAALCQLSVAGPDQHLRPTQRHTAPAGGGAPLQLTSGNIVCGTWNQPR